MVPIRCFRTVHMKILIIDDDPVSRAVLQKILTAQPEHQTTVAEDGRSGWALLDDSARYFDVVFLDITLPDVDGLQLLQAIRQSRFLRKLEVVMCTGSTDRVTISKAIQLGARHYLVKPCSPEVVLAKLRQIKPAGEAAVEHQFAGTISR